MQIRVNTNQMEEIEGLHSEYPYAYHYVDLTKTTVPWHWHEAFEFGLVTCGNVTVSTTTKTETFACGEAFFFNSNVVASVSTEGEGILDSHLFHPILLAGHFKSVFETKYLNPILQNRHLELVPIRGETITQRRLLDKLGQLERLQREENVEFRTRNLLSDIWLLLLEVVADLPIHTAPTATKEQERILSMLSFIHEKYAEKLTLESIAASAAISRRECLRCFRACIHQSPIDYLISYRIEVAKKLLTTTTLPITEIALQCGFGSGAYFGKLFQRSCATTPLAYRKSQTVPSN